MADINTQPRPTQFSTSDLGLSPLQSEYIKVLQNQPSQSEIYGKAREGLGIGEQEKILSGMNRSVLDLEGKIKGVSENVGERTKDFLVTEAQRERRINVEEQPLRDQYLELLRRREGQAGILSSLQGQLGEQMGFAKEDSGRTLTALEQMLKFQAENKKAREAGGGVDYKAIARILKGEDGTDTPEPTSVLDENTEKSLIRGAFSGMSESDGSVSSGLSEIFSIPTPASIGAGIGQDIKQKFLTQQKKRNTSNRSKGRAANMGRSKK